MNGTGSGLDRRTGRTEATLLDWSSVQENMLNRFTVKGWSKVIAS